jgi:membrane-associated protein
MDYRQILDFLDQYGMAVIFVVVFLEYLNLPGFPAGVILPATGVWLSHSGGNIFLAFFLSVLAGLLGSIVLYSIGYLGQDVLLSKIIARNGRFGQKLARYEAKMLGHARRTIFIAKLIPVIRTLICFPAGAAKVAMRDYITSSTAGIAIWNGVLIFSGYFLGYGFFGA